MIIDMSKTQCPKCGGFSKSTHKIFYGQCTRVHYWEYHCEKCGELLGTNEVDDLAYRPSLLTRYYAKNPAVKDEKLAL